VTDRCGPTTHGSSAAQQRRKTGDQAALGASAHRARLIEAVVAAVAESGYESTSISDLTRRAGVPRTAYYRLFADKEACFIDAHRQIAERVSDEIRDAIAQGQHDRAAQSAVSALVAFAEREPASFTFLTHEATLAGRAAWQQRERLIGALAQEIQRAWGEAQSPAEIPDVPAELLLGGAIRALGIRLRAGVDHPESLRDDLIAWVDAHRTPRTAGGWRSVRPSTVRRRSLQQPAPAPVEPATLPKGRHRLSTDEVERIQRARILHATARAIAKNGYSKTTVADIVAQAGLSREVFYEHFRGKQEAFAETVKFVFEQLIAATAGAFFTEHGSWPDRVWQAGRAFTRFIVEQPALAYAVFVEPYTIASDVQRADDFLIGFTLFLEDGYRWRPEAAQLGRLASEAIAGAVLETITFYLRHDRAAELPTLLPLITYIILAPFTGPDAALGLAQRKMRETI
jgi:AcrR family transcriptional regulator